MALMLQFVKMYPWRTAGVLGALLVAGIVEGASLSALIPVLSFATKGGDEELSAPGQWIVDRVESVGIEPTLGFLLSLSVAGIIIQSLIALGAKRQVGFTVVQVGTDLRLEMLRSLLASRWEYFLRQPIGKLANSVTSECSRASKAYMHGATILATSVQLSVFIVVAMMVHWQATAVTLAAALALSVGFRTLIRAARKAGRKQTKLQTRLMKSLVDSLSSVKPLKAMAREDLAGAVLAADTQRLNDVARRQIMAKEKLRAVQTPAFMVMLATGAWVCLEVWQMPAPSVLILIVLITRILSNIGAIQKQIQEMAVCESAYWEMHKTTSEAVANEEHLPKGRTPTLDRGIRLEEVHFSYDGTPVLAGCDLEVPAGGVTCLVGPSGAGKTTVVDLVLGLLRPQDGLVTVDDVPLEEIDIRAWRHITGYVPQENMLVNDSVLQNVTLGDPRVSEEDAIRALQDAGAWEFVAAQPGGIQENVGERGARFSGGQRQRIVIARALAHGPRLLILDEATSALDPKTEAALCETLAQLKGRLTILSISHQPALVDVAERVYRIEKGQAHQVRAETLLNEAG